MFQSAPTRMGILEDHSCHENPLHPLMQEDHPAESKAVNDGGYFTMPERHHPPEKSQFSWVFCLPFPGKWVVYDIVISTLISQ